MAPVGSTSGHTCRSPSSSSLSSEEGSRRHNNLTPVHHQQFSSSSHMAGQGDMSYRSMELPHRTPSASSSGMAQHQQAAAFYLPSGSTESLPHSHRSHKQGGRGGPVTSSPRSQSTSSPSVTPRLMDSNLLAANELSKSAEFAQLKRQPPESPSANGLKRTVTDTVLLQQGLGANGLDTPPESPGGFRQGLTASAPPQRRNNTPQHPPPQHAVRMGVRSMHRRQEPERTKQEVRGQLAILTCISCL